MPLQVQVPADDHDEKLIACQAACPVHTDARGYVRAVAEGRLEDAAADAYIARQRKFDPDLWVIEIEDPERRYLLDADIV